MVSCGPTLAISHCPCYRRNSSAQDLQTRDKWLIKSIRTAHKKGRADTSRSAPLEQEFLLGDAIRNHNEFDRIGRLIIPVVVERIDKQQAAHLYCVSIHERGSV